MKGMTPDFRESLRKALDLAAIAGKTTQPEVDKVIQDLINYNNPLRAAIPRVPGSGEAYLLNRRTATGTADFVNDSEEPGDTDSTYDRKTFSFKTILERGKVTQFAQDAGRSYKDLLAEEMDNASRVVRNKEEDAIINGSVSANPKSFDGLRILTPSGQVIEAGGSGGDGDVLSLTLMDEAFDLCLGSPDVVICSKRTRRKLYSLLQATQQFVGTTEVKGGFRVMAYNDAGAFYSQFISDAQTQGDSDIASDLFVLDTDFVSMAVLSEAKMVPLAKTSSQFDAFDVRVSEVLVMKNPVYGIARLAGIIPAVIVP